jgi:hypothetical protein
MGEIKAEDVDAVPDMEDIGKIPSARKPRKRT